MQGGYGNGFLRSSVLPGWKGLGVKNRVNHKIQKKQEIRKERLILDKQELKCYILCYLLPTSKC